MSGKDISKEGREKIAKFRQEEAKAKRPDLSHIETPGGSKAVPVGTKGDYALVDEEDYDRVMMYNWHLKGGYANNHTIGRMHRFIMGVTDTTVLVDHIFHNTLDNRKSQLRVCDKTQNSMNSKPRKGTSAYKGVYWANRERKWVSRITVYGKVVSLGTFKAEIEAAKSYDEAAKKYHKDFAHLNFPNA